MEYRITLKNNLKALRTTLIYHILGIIFYGYALYTLDHGHGVFTLVFGIAYAVSILPVMLLHVEYYIRNRGDVVSINVVQKIISINGEIIPFDEIEKITLYMAPVWYRKRPVRIFPFEDYRYSKIQMKAGNYFIFTCLMEFEVDKLMAAIRGVPIEKKARPIATPLIEIVIDFLY